MKKRYLTLPLLLLYSVAWAEQPSTPAGMNTQQMQHMMQQAQQLHGCMNSLKPATLERLKHSSIAADARLQALCKDGKRQEAERYAQQFAQELNHSEDMKAFQSCGKQAMALMQDTPMQKLMDTPPADSGHFCDHYIAQK